MYDHFIIHEWYRHVLEDLWEKLLEYNKVSIMSETMMIHQCKEYKEICFLVERLSLGRRVIYSLYLSSIIVFGLHIECRVIFRMFPKGSQCIDDVIDDEHIFNHRGIRICLLISIS